MQLQPSHRLPFTDEACDAFREHLPRILRHVLDALLPHRAVSLRDLVLLRERRKVDVLQRGKDEWMLCDVLGRK